MDVFPDTTALVGTLVAGRYRLVSVIGRGGVAAVYEGHDSDGGRFAIKVFTHEVAAKFPEYTEHLESVREALGNSRVAGLILPVEVGVTEKFAFEVFHLINRAENLETVIRNSKGISLGTSLKITAHLANALSSLHSSDIIHADVKPTNILVSGDVALDNAEVYLTDFGMARPSGSGSDVLLVGTFAYMHPTLRGSLRDQPKTWFARTSDASTAAISSSTSFPVEAVRVGPFIDLYALGVVLVQLVTGTVRFSGALSERELISRFSASGNVARLPDELKQRVIHFAKSLLFIQPASPATAGQIAHEATELYSLVVAAASTSEQTQVEREEVEAVTSPDRTSEEVLVRLQSISESLSGNTIVGLSTRQSLSVLTDNETDQKLLGEISDVFTNALKRTKNVWVITMIMTICSFALIVSMILLAVTLAIYTGKSQWGLVFGGASIPLILGTLLWHPFDRIFRSTILTQQLELIHIQTIAGFSATHDLNKRMRICREASNSLALLFDKHAMGESGREKEAAKRAKRKQ